MLSSSRKAPVVAVLRQARQPLFWAAIAHSLGIIAGLFFWRPEFWWLFAGCAFTVAAAFFVGRRVWLPGAFALGALFLGGALHVELRGSSPRLDASIQRYADGEDLQVVAHVIHDARLRAGEEADQVVDVETESITNELGEMVKVKSGVRLSIYSPPRLSVAVVPLLQFPLLHYGERICFSGKLRLPHNFRNPGNFDYESYLADHGIAALGSAKAENVARVPGFTGSQLAAWRSHVRGNILGRVQEIWPAREASLLDAMLIGEEAFLDRDTRVDFQRSGTYHVLIVSGMNVSILAFVVFCTLRRLRLGEIPATFLTVACCVAYALLTEVGAPVWRATLMCAIYLGARLLYRERAMVNAIGGAALMVLVFDPKQLFAASFQMTFLSVLLVAAIGVPILDRTSQLYKRALFNWNSSTYARSLAPSVQQLRLELRMIAGRVGAFIGNRCARIMVREPVRLGLRVFEVLFVSAVMQMGLALPMAYYFHRATTIGMPANIAVVPLTQLMMPMAIAALVCSTVSVVLAKLPAFLTALALKGIVGTVHRLGGIRLADLRVPTPSLFVIVLATAALILAMIAARRQAVTVTWSLAGLCLTALVIALAPATPAFRSGVIELTSIDVGEGDANFLVSPQGKTLLVDAGGPVGPFSTQFDFGEEVVSPYLWSRGVSRLDAVAITHGHSDHIGGMLSVLKNFRPRELWLGVRPPSAALDRVLEEAETLHIKVVRHWEGDSFDWGGETVQVLFPPRDWPVGLKPQNSDSMVLEVGTGATSILLEGDAEKQVERRIAALHQPRANVLKVGHHGSANATTEELLQSVKPDYAVISVGLRNSFGLPKIQTLNHLERSGTKVYRTDLDGAVTFYLDGRTATPALAAFR